MEYDYGSSLTGAGEVSLHAGALRLTSHERGLVGIFDTQKMLSAIVALANAALPDSDSRKITRAHVEMLRNDVGATGQAYIGQRDWRDCEEIEACILRLASILESYLPPEGA